MRHARVERSPRALQDIAEAVDWYLARSPLAAARFLSELETALDRVRRTPKLYAEARNAVRRCLVRGFPFAILYEQRADEIVVVAVAHTAREPGSWLEG